MIFTSSERAYMPLPISDQ